jgi:hypothetical protein
VCCVLCLLPCVFALCLLSCLVLSCGLLRHVSCCVFRRRLLYIIRLHICPCVLGVSVVYVCLCVPLALFIQSFSRVACLYLPALMPVRGERERRERERWERERMRRIFDLACSPACLACLSCPSLSPTRVLWEGEFSCLARKRERGTFAVCLPLSSLHNSLSLSLSSCSALFELHPRFAPRDTPNS